MSNKRFRNVTRIFHIIAGSMIAALVYSSALKESDVYLALMQFVIMPGLIISGVALWQQPKIMKFLRRNEHRSSNN
jgi:hypothetical protein